MLWGKRHFAAYVCLILVSTVVALAVQGLILFPSDYLGWYYPFRGYQDFAPYASFLPNTHYQDVPFYFFPFWDFVGHQLSQGVFPLWNPLEGAGSATTAGHPLGLYFPVHWVTYGLFSPLVAWHVDLMLVFLTTAFASFTLFRRWSGDSRAATLGSLAWTLSCGHATYFQELCFSWPLALLPLVLCGLDDIDKKKTRGPLIVGVASSFLMVVAHLQFTVPAMALIGFFAFRSKNRRWLKVGSVAAGVCLASPHLVSVAELLLLSNRSPLSEDLIALQLLAPREYLNFLYPFFAGSPESGFFLARTMGGHVFNGREHCLYFGQIPFILAVLALLRTRERRIKWLGALVIAGFLLAGSQFLYSLVTTVLPPLKYLTPSRFIQFLHLGCCYLACLGWCSLAKTPLRRREAQILAAILMVWLTGVLSFVIPANLGSSSFAAWILELASRGGVNKPPYFAGNFGEVIVERIVAHFSLTSFAVWLPTVLLVSGLLALFALPRYRFPAVLTILTVDLLFYFFMFNRPVERETFYPEVPSVTMLKEGHQMAVDGSKIPFRVAAVGRGLHPNILSVYGIASFEQYSSIQPGNFRQIFTRLNTREEVAHQLACFTTPEQLSPGLLDLFGISTLYNEPPPQARGGGALQLSISPPRATALRAFTLNRYRVSSDTSSMYQPDFDPRTEVLLESSPGFPSSDSANFSTVTPTFYGCNEVRFEVSPTEPTLLVLGDLHYPGWRVWVNGQERTLHQAYGFVRAVELPAGDSTVLFRYRPTGWLLTLSLAAGGLVFLIIAGWVIGKSRSPERPESHQALADKT